MGAGLKFGFGMTELGEGELLMQRCEEGCRLQIGWCRRLGSCRLKEGSRRGLGSCRLKDG